MQVQEYWDTIGCTKDFDDPLPLERLSHFLSKDARIAEYGCGYGRLLGILKAAGYDQLVGFDFASGMIQRAKKEHPELILNLLEDSLQIPLADKSQDAFFISTVLCSMIDNAKQLELMNQVHRVLNDTGIFYFSDFLISDDAISQQKYQKGMQEHGVWGQYTTTDGLVVRHYTSKWIFQLLEDFEIQWFEQFTFQTMNGNPAKTFRCIAKKLPKSS